MFNFVRKIFKALNSSGKAWQLSLAIVLAMFAGFLPAKAFILFIIFFLALVLNLNFGLFLLFTVIFSGIGYLFDPLFDSLGYAILTNESLNGFFTTLYNSAIFRWSSFNYTLVTGSLIVSILLALPLFFILNKLILVYRVQLGERLNTWKLTKWMKLFNEEAKDSSVFRWWGLGVFGGLAALILLLFLLLFDPLAKMAIEKGLSCTLQTQVTLKDFSSSLRNLSVKALRLEIADKDKLSHNAVQVEEISFDLGFAALLQKKAMIEKLKLNAVAFDVKRAEAAQAYTHQEEDKKEAKESKVDESQKSYFVLPNVDDILEKEELKSVVEAQKLRADIKATEDKWKKVSVELKKADDVSQIKSDSKRLETQLKGADIKKIISAKKDIDALKSKIEKTKQRYSSLKTEFYADQQRLQRQIRELENLPKEDIQRLKNKYSLNASGGANLVSTLIGNKVGSYMHSALKYYEMIKPYLKNDAKTKEVEEIKPPRGEGRWVKYTNLSTIPQLLIKVADVNVKLQNDEININIKDISSNQKLYGKPLVAHADSKGRSYKDMRADLVDDRRQQKAKTDFDLRIRALKTDAYSIGSIGMKNIITDGTFKGEIIDKIISAKSNIKVLKVKLQMPSQKLMNDILQGVSSFNVDLSLKGEIEKPSISVKSDLDKQLSKGLKSMASKEAKKFEKELEAGVMKKTAGLSRGMNTDLGDTGSILNSKQEALSGINTNFSSSSKSLKGILPF